MSCVPRRWILIENVSALISPKLTALWEYLLQDRPAVIVRQFVKPRPSLSEGSGCGGLRAGGRMLAFRPVSREVKPLVEVSRERIFLLATKDDWAPKECVAHTVEAD